MYNVNDVRRALLQRYEAEAFVKDKGGTKTIELIAPSFIADEDHIFGEPNKDYIDREIAWYESQSLYVADIPGDTPKIWDYVSSIDGRINSNYGFLIWSETNGDQWKHCLNALVEDANTRRAIMIYTRPSIQTEYDFDGMSDFICTNTVQYMIRNGSLYSIVSMRSNDAWAGYRNDRAWQLYVAKKMVEAYKHDTGKPLHLGPIIWNAGSLHVYESQFYLLDHYAKTGETHITKKEYDERYA